LTFYLLGAPRLQLDGEPVHISRRRAVALLAYLALTGRSHSRDALATLLWSEHDQSSALAGLRRTLSVLNTTLGDEWLAIDRETAGVNPEAEIWLDVRVFRGKLAACEGHDQPGAELCADCVGLLEEAVALYRDDFMAGFTLRGSAAFDEWQFFETEGLRDDLAGALERLMRHHSSQEDYEPAIAYARRWVALDPLHEPAQRHLMALYAQAGQRSAALRQYRLCKQALAEELDLAPSEATEALYERIRSGVGLKAGRPPHNLPPQPTAFVGREEELAELEQLIGDPEVRLVTIVGPGGIGKTRLALAAAEEQLDARVPGNPVPVPRFPHGVYYASLAGLESPDQVAPTVARAVELPLRQEREPRQQLVDYAREKRLLLVLDNLEHLLEGVDLLAEILEVAPGVQILATSRERLHLRQGQVYPLEGLGCPDWETRADVPDDVDPAGYEAIELFLHSGQRVAPHIQLTEETVPHVARTCRFVEGMPLGIELAAAWVDVLPPEEIAAETERSLGFLEADWWDMPARHRSVRAAFDASWARLGQAERELFPQLSVFRGGFTREAAREVAVRGDGSLASLRTLATLADKSMLQYDQVSDRYQIHELLRQYGAEKLGMDSKREAAVRDRHCAAYCARLEAWGRELEGAGQQAALAEIEADLENAQAAWRWAVARGKVACIDRAMDGLCGFFELRYRHQEGERAAGMAARSPLLAPDYGLAPHARSGDRKPAKLTAEHQRALARALAWQARFGEILGNAEAANRLRDQAMELLKASGLADDDRRAVKALTLVTPIPWPGHLKPYEDVEDMKRGVAGGLALYRELGNQWRQADALLGLAAIATRSDALEEARKLYQESLGLYRELGNQQRQANALNGLGWVARSLGAYDEAIQLWEKSLALAEAQTDLWDMAISETNLGYLAMFQGRFQQAARWLERSVAHAREIGDRMGLAYYLVALGKAYVFSGSLAQAPLPMDEALALSQVLDSPALQIYALKERAWLDAHLGKYEEAFSRARMAPPPLLGAAGVGEGWDSIGDEVPGWVALAREAYAEAAGILEESAAKWRRARSAETREWLAWRLAGLGLAELGVGSRPAARGHLLEALEISLDMGAFIPLLHLVPVIAVVLADAGEVERAVEVYALAESHPYVASSQLFEDIAGRFVEAAAAALPPHVAEAAREQGRTLDWWETAEELLDELREAS
jgi:predicted ATPase/DNA-binding SARP family transcriptional activator